MANKQEDAKLNIRANVLRMRMLTLSICTTHALVYLFQSMLQFLDRGNTSIRIFFADFSKGFDLVDHNVLLEELHVLNVHPSIVRWIGAFFV